MEPKLAIIDWGIGGLGIYRQVKDKLGGLSIVYFSDTGATPYGKMSLRELVSRLNIVVTFLKAAGVTHLVIGCNAASTAIEHLDLQGLEVEGIIASAVAAAMRQEPKRLGLIGGRRTIFSGVYRAAFAARGVAVEQRIAQPLSGMIERGDIGSDELRAECRRILTPLRSCSHILLACTHYPAIEPLLKEYVSTQTKFVDPAGEVVKVIGKWKLKCDGDDKFMTTGDAELMKRSAGRAFGVKIASVSEVVL